MSNLYHQEEIIVQQTEKKTEISKYTAYSNFFWTGVKAKKHSLLDLLLSSFYHRRLTGTKLYWLVTEAHVREQLADSRYLAANRPAVEHTTS